MGKSIAFVHSLPIGIISLEEIPLKSLWNQDHKK